MRSGKDGRYYICAIIIIATEPRMVHQIIGCPECPVRFMDILPEGPLQYVNQHPGTHMQHTSDARPAQPIHPGCHWTKNRRQSYERDGLLSNKSSEDRHACSKTTIYPPYTPSYNYNYKVLRAPKTLTTTLYTYYWPTKNRTLAARHCTEKPKKASLASDQDGRNTSANCTSKSTARPGTDAEEDTASCNTNKVAHA